MLQNRSKRIIERCENTLRLITLNYVETYNFNQINFNISNLNVQYRILKYILNTI